MALPLLLGAAKGLLSNATKSVVKKKAASTAKDFVTGKGKDKKKGGALVKKGSSTESSTKAKVKPTQKYAGGSASSVEKSTSTKAEVSSGGSDVSYEKLTQQLDNIVGLTSSLDKAFQGQYTAKKAESKKKDKKRQEEKREDREGSLEKGGGRLLGAVGAISGVASRFNIFNFLLNTLLGGLAVLFLKNFDSIKSFFTDFGKAFGNKMNLLKWGIYALAGPFKSATKIVLKVFKPALKLMGKTFNKVFTGMGKLLGKALVGIGKGTVRLAKSLAAKVASAGAKAAGASGASAASKNARSGTKGTGSTSAPKNGLRSGAPSKAATKKFGKQGAKRLGSFSKAFKRIPILGALIGVGIDLAMGETLDKAIVGAIGGSLGAALGGFIGSLVFPGVGTFIGGVIGAGLGEYLAKNLYGQIAKNLTGQGLSPLGEGGELTAEEIRKRGAMKPGDETEIDGKRMVWTGMEFVTPEEYRNNTPRLSSAGTGPIDMGADVNAKLKKAAEYAIQAGFTKEQAKIMAAIAGGESTFNNRAHNPNRATGDNSYGLWQINMIDEIGVERRRQLGISSNEDLFDPVTNARAAKAIFDSQGFNAWGAYKDGNAAKYMNAAKALDLSGTTSAPQVTPTRTIIPGMSVPQNSFVLKDAYGNPLSDIGKSETPSIAPTASPTAQSSSVASRASYEGGRSQTVTIPYPTGGGGQESPMMGGGSGGVMVMGGSTRSLVNSYYKSKLMGFLYKQG